MGSTKNLIGQRFGRLLVVNQDGKNKDGSILWKCKCDCGKYKTIRRSNLTNGNTNSCGCLLAESAHNRSFKGIKNTGLGYYNVLKKKALKRGFVFDISLEYIVNLLEQQNYKCALSGLEIRCSTNRIKKSNTYMEQTASLDRIDSSQGYIEGNVQWVHKKINFMKQNYSEKEFIKLCQLVVEYNK